MSGIEVKQRSKPNSPASSQAPATRQATIVTRAERAECSCPESCERDHEQD